MTPSSRAAVRNLSAHKDGWPSTAKIGRSWRTRGAAIGLLLLLLLGLVGVALSLLRRPAVGPVLATITVGQGPRFVAIDSGTGQAFVAGQEGVLSASPVTTGVVSFAPSIPGSITMIDLRSGQMVRTIGVSHFPTGVYVDGHHHRAFVLDFGTGGGTSEVSVFDTATGARIATTVLPGSADTAGVDARAGRVLVVNFRAGTVGVFDARTGHLLHTAPVAFDPGPVAVLVDERTHRAFVESLPGGYGTGTLGAINVIDTLRGRLVHRVAVGSSPDDGMTLDDGANRVYVLNALNGTVSILDARTGLSIRTVRLTASGFPTGPGAIVVDERAHLAFVDHGWTSVFDTRTGTILATHTFSTVPGPLVIDQRTDQVFAATYRDGHVRVLDGRSGRVLRTVDVGQAPTDMAVDELTGRVYVVTAGSVLSTSAPVSGGSPAPRGPGRVYVLDARSGAIRDEGTVGLNPVVMAADQRDGRVVVLNMAGLTPAPDPWSWIPGDIRRHLPFVPAPPSTFQNTDGSVSILDATR